MIMIKIIIDIIIIDIITYTIITIMNIIQAQYFNNCLYYFVQISEPVNFWKWLHSTVIPTLKPTYWYGPYNNNEEQVLWTEDHIKRKSRRGWKVKIHKRVSGKTQVEGQAAFDNTSVHKFPTNVIADRGTAYIVGSARLRQLRVKQGTM